MAGEALLDLCYEEDAGAEVDCNVVMTGEGALVEVQGTAEGEPFTRAQMDALLDLATAGIADLSRIQRAALGLMGFPAAHRPGDAERAQDPRAASDLRDLAGGVDHARRSGGRRRRPRSRRPGRPTWRTRC